MTRSQLAKDVASELEARRRRRRALFFLVWAAAILAALMYLRCGRGWGTGGKGPGKGEGTGSAAVQGPKRCVVRVTATGITVDGKEMKREEAVAACKATEGALVTVTGDARQGDWDELRAALEAAGVQIFTKGS
jgi:hypothetical protein